MCCLPMKGTHSIKTTDPKTLTNRRRIIFEPFLFPWPIKQILTPIGQLLPPSLVGITLMIMVFLLLDHRLEVCKCLTEGQRLSKEIHCPL